MQDLHKPLEVARDRGKTQHYWRGGVWRLVRVLPPRGAASILQSRSGIAATTATERMAAATKRTIPVVYQS